MPESTALQSAADMLRRDGARVVVNVSEFIEKDNAHRWGHGVSFKPTREQAETLASMIEAAA